MNEQLTDEIRVQKLVQLSKYVGIAVLAASILYGAVAWQKARADDVAAEAFEALFKVEKIEQAAFKEAQVTSSNPLQVFKNWPEDKKKDYLEKLAEVQRKYPETAAAAMAGLKIGRWHFEEKKYDEAIQAYDAVLKTESIKNFPLYGALAIEGLGTALESQQKYEEAAKRFDESLKLKANPLKPLAFLGKARNLKALGRADEAKKTYEQLIAEFPGGNFEKKARVLMETLSL